jgi:hypothetical protein
MRRPTPLLYLGLVERESARRSPLTCPPFGDVRRLWRCRNPVVLNKSASVGTFLRKGRGQPRDGNPRLCKALLWSKSFICNGLACVPTEEAWRDTSQTVEMACYTKYSSRVHHFNYRQENAFVDVRRRTSHRGEDQSRRSGDGADQAGFPDQTFSSPRIETRDEPPHLPS